MDKENEKISRTISNLLSLVPARKGKKKNTTPLGEKPPESIDDELIRKVVDKETEEKAASGGNVDYKERFENLKQEYQREREKTAKILDENDEFEEKIEELQKKIKFNEKYISILKESAEK